MEGGRLETVPKVLTPQGRESFTVERISLTESPGMEFALSAKPAYRRLAGMF